MTTPEFLAEVRNTRRKAPKEWHTLCAVVDGKTVMLKFFDKSIATMEVDGLACGGIWDIPTVKNFLSVIASNLE